MNLNSSFVKSLVCIICMLLLPAIFILIMDRTATINNYHTTERLHSTNTNSTTIHIYGGSITYGVCNGCDRYSNILGDYLIENGIDDALITNFAVSASGPEHWLHCGIEYADIIISEFRLNEQSQSILEEWYEVASNSSRHLIVLDLWTWAVPPYQYAHASSNAAMKFVQDESAGASILYLDGFPNNWREFIPLYYNYTYEQIPLKCFLASLERGTDEEKVVQNCRNTVPGLMQHGTQLFHYAIAKQLAMHIKEVVVPRLLLAREVENINRQRSGICIGEWGGQHLFSSVWVTSAMRNVSGFYIGSPLTGRSDKVTLHANSTDARLVLACPAPYKSAQVGYIAHTDFEESGTVKLNGIIVKTLISDPHLNAHTRIRKYSPKFASPLSVSVGHLESLAYIELTELACQ